MHYEIGEDIGILTIGDYLTKDSNAVESPLLKNYKKMGRMAADYVNSGRKTQEILKLNLFKDTVTTHPIIEVVI